MGYFQVRSAPTVTPTRPRSALAAVTPPTTRWSETIELLPLIRTERDQVSGQWTLRDGRLESIKQYGARIEIPYQPPAEYVLTAIVEPLDEPNGLILGQRLGDHRFLVLVNYQRPGHAPASALENVDGLNVDLNATTLESRLLERNRLSTVVCTVRKDGVTVTCDGRSVIDWKGAASRLSLSDYWHTPRDVLFLGAYDCRYRFHRVSLTPISGTGKEL